jgi:GntR family transcriptional regulator of vanillate catabolism
MSKPSSTRALSIADTLRNRIYAGLLPPDTHLIEVPLASELGVSRTPLRDALGRLADEGLLAYVPNRGYIVRRFRFKDVYDAYTLRANLEGFACRLACQNGIDADAMARLDAILAEQWEVLYTGDWSAERALKWHDLNLKFHALFLEIADNHWLSEAVSRVRRLPLIFDSEGRPRNHGEIKLLYQREHSREAYSEHLRLAAAFKRGEASRAESLMSEHVLHNRDVLNERFEQENEARQSSAMP